MNEIIIKIIATIFIVIPLCVFLKKPFVFFKFEESEYKESIMRFYEGIERMLLVLLSIIGLVMLLIL